MHGVVLHAVPGLRFVHGKRLPQLLEDPFRHSGRVPSLLEVVEQHGELVTPSRATMSPGRTVPFEPAGHFHQHLITGGVAQSVVHRLEAVEIDEEHGGAVLGRALLACQRPLQLLEEESAIGQAGQRVVEGLARQPLFEFDARAHFGAQFLVQIGQPVGVGAQRPHQQQPYRRRDHEGKQPRVRQRYHRFVSTLGKQQGQQKHD